MKAFAKRMTNSTLSQELASAGLNGASRNLAMNIKTKKYNSSLTSIYGNYMKLNSNQVSNCDQDKDYAQFYDKIENEKIPSYGDFTYFMLFDYAPNDRKKSEAIDKPKVTSLLTDYARVSPNKTSPRKSEIDTITIDVTREPLTVEELGKKYASQKTQKSANYGIDSTGRISLYVPEKDRSWFSYGSNDNRAITIAVSSEATSPYKISDEAYDSLVDILVDICERNGIKMLIWNTDKDARVNHTDGSNMTVLRDFSTTSDGPGDYLYEKMGDIAEVVNRRLGVIW